jgi:hypothetical protein
VAFICWLFIAPSVVFFALIAAAQPSPADGNFPVALHPAPAPIPAARRIFVLNTHVRLIDWLRKLQEITAAALRVTGERNLSLMRVSDKHWQEIQGRGVDWSTWMPAASPSFVLAADSFSGIGSIPGDSSRSLRRSARELGVF